MVNQIAPIPAGTAKDVMSEEDVDRLFQRGGSLFTQLFDNSTIGMTVAATTGQFLRVNPAFERFIGYSSAELTQMSYLDITHPDDIPLSVEIRDDIRKRLTPREVTEKRYLSKDGSVKWGSITRALVTDDETDLQLFVAQIQDVTEKVNSQNAHRESEQRLEAFLDAAADRYWETDAEHRYTYISAQLDSDQRPVSESMIGRRRWETESAMISDPHWETYRALIAKQEPFKDYEYTRIRPNGTEAHIRTSGIPIINNNGEFCGYRGINREISHEITVSRQAENLAKMAQQRLFDAMENIDAGIILWDSESRFVYCNSFYTELQPAADKLVPGSRFKDYFKQVTGQRLKSFQTEKERLEYSENLGEVADVNRDFDYQAADGRWIRRRRQLLTDGSIVSFHTDITEQRRAENLKDEFVSLVSHELRTPLTSVMGAVGLAMEGVTGDIPQETHDMLEIAYRNCQTLTGHVNNILDLSKIEAGEMVFDMTLVEIMPLIEEAIELNSIFAAQLGCQYELQSGLAVSMVFADPVRISQVLTNLLSNAAKYAPQSGIIELAVTEDGGQIRISVTDHGKGIPHHLRDKIFDRFTQAEETNTRRSGGTGLGLSIAKEIVEYHDGRIDFETQIGDGTTFFFELPAVVEQRSVAG